MSKVGRGERDREREREKEREKGRGKGESTPCVDLIISINDLLKLAKIISSSFCHFLLAGLSATFDAIESIFPPVEQFRDK